MIVFSNKIRSTQPEIMDNLDFQGEEMKNLLVDLKTVNKWLGGNAITINGIQKLLNENHANKKITILDIGCGDGELLRKCAKFGIQNQYNFKLIGIDFNENILKLAKEQSTEYSNIYFKKVDVLVDEELVPNYDIAVCSLFLHHFSNQQIEILLKAIINKGSIGLIVNDLHRNRLAFNLFKIFSFLFLSTKTARHDGLVSIARGFKKSELTYISNKVPNQKSTIHWRWAYRYQWILKKTRCV